MELQFNLQLYISSYHGNVRQWYSTMAIYAIGILPLMKHPGLLTTLQLGKTATAPHVAHQLHNTGPLCDYFTNPIKTWLIVNDDYNYTCPLAKELCSDMGVNVATEGEQHLRQPMCRTRWESGYHNSNSQNTTAHCLLIFYPWPIEQMDIHPLHHPQHCKPATTT